MNSRLLPRALLSFLLGLSSIPQATASTLDRILEQGYFTWGADEEGGGPYVFKDPADPERRTGFEVDLAALLAGEISRASGRTVEPRFMQGQWDRLPDLLGTGRIDLVLNGYEWSPERARLMACTLPYYVYELQLLTRAGEGRIDGIGSLGALPGVKVGVLGGSAAERLVRESFPGGGIEIRSYDGNTNAMSDVASGRLDATVQDLPIALFYAREFPSLRFSGNPVAPGRYVIFLRKEDQPLREALNRAITALRDRGSLRLLYERYGIWTPAQEDPALLSLPAFGEGSSPAAEAGFFARHGLILLRAAGTTVLLALASMPIAILLGLGIALGRLHGPRALSTLLAVYVEVLRGTPLLLQLYVIFYVFPGAGINLDPIPAAILGLAINYSAYEAEIYRAGLQAVPAGQMEAALALGMSRSLALRRIIIPQAVRLVIPPVTNDFIALFKDTSVASVITVVELSKQYNIAAMTHPSEMLPLAGVAALLYLAMSYPLSILSARLERRHSR